MHQLRRQELGGVSPLSSCNFENFSLDYYSDQPNPEFGFSPRENMRSILPQCVDYAQHFSADCPSLFFAGDAGLGKTHLALSIANRVLNAGFDVLYLSSQTALAAIDRDRYTCAGGVAAQNYNLQEMERKLILDVLNKTGGNKSKAAELLGITREGLRKKLLRMGINDKELPHDDGKA